MCAVLLETAAAAAGAAPADDDTSVPVCECEDATDIVLCCDCLVHARRYYGVALRLSVAASVQMHVNQMQCLIIISLRERMMVVFCLMKNGALLNNNTIY